MKKLLTAFLIGFMVILLNSCALWSDLWSKQDVVRNRDNDYLKSQSTPPLQVPAGTSSINIGNDYPIPGSIYPSGNNPISQLPPGSLAAQNTMAVVQSQAKAKQ